jgi:hypothetical protein
MRPQRFESSTSAPEHTGEVRPIRHGVIGTGKLMRESHPPRTNLLMVREWKAKTSKVNISISQFVIEHVGNSLRQEEGLVSSSLSEHVPVASSFRGLR